MAKKKKEEIRYGCINEDEFQLQSPRLIDGDECKSIRAAVLTAIEMILAEEVLSVSIVKCRLEGPEGDASWVEIPGDGCIQIDAYGAKWLEEERQ